VLAKLGRGSEGAAYLVQEPDGRKRVVKLFNKSMTQREIDEHLELLDQFRRKDIPVPTVLGAASDKRSFEMEYVQGVPVLELTKYPERFGLTPAQGVELRGCFELFKNDIQRNKLRSHFETIQDFNVVYEFKTGRFVVIDPH
jgi:hypothetical protein